MATTEPPNGLVDVHGDERETTLRGQPSLRIARRRVAIPEPVPAYVHRAELVERVNPTRRRLTLLKAAGGFGKTTLLAASCRRLREDGVAVGWVTVEKDDEPAVLDACIALACGDAGLQLGESPDTPGPQGTSRRRVGLLAQRVRSLGKPFVIAFDALERLEDGGAVSLLEFLLQRAPSNLHLAVACREIPGGFNVAEALLDGRAEAIGSEDLRFSKADVARFFGLSLSSEALAGEVERSAGWPLALRVSMMSRNSRQGGAARSPRFLLGNWIESRLLVDLVRDDRDFLLDLGLFGRIDAALLAEVLGGPEPIRRLESLSTLDGFLLADDGSNEGWRLQPQLRDYCARQRFREDPERFRTIHRRIAAVLAARGETVRAMRHAVESGDPLLAGDILEEAGGVRLWTSQGVAQLREASRMLSDAVMTQRPRLRLVRCIALTLSGRHDEARALYRKSRRDRRGDGDGPGFEYAVDDCVVRSGMALYGMDAVGPDWLPALASEVAELSASTRLDPPTRGNLEYALCVVHFLKGEFGLALERLDVATDYLAGTRYIALYGEVLRGQVDFARGCVPAARSHFRMARQIAATHYPEDPVATISWEVAQREMAMECSPLSTAVRTTGLQSALTRHGVPFSFFATASNLLIDANMRAGRVDKALVAAEELLGHVREAGLTTFARLIAALRVSVLARVGRVDDAERAWRRDALPTDVDSAVRTWREVDAVSEARVRLLIARRRFGEARSVLTEVRAFAAGRGIRRVEMRAVAMSVMLEHTAGESEASIGGMREYMEFYAESPYAWPLVRDRAACADVMRKFVESSEDSVHMQTAQALLAVLRRADAAAAPWFSLREREVLVLLPGRKVKEVADSLGLSVHGVRYHLRKLFMKLDVTNRVELQHRARAMDLIPDDS